MTEPLTCYLHGIEECHIKVGDNVAIVGDGPTGLMHLQLAKMVGAGKTIVSGQIDDRLNLAKKLGADTIVNETREDPIRKVMDETENGGADVVIVAVGSLVAAETRIKIVEKRLYIKSFWRGLTRFRA